MSKILNFSTGVKNGAPYISLIRFSKKSDGGCIGFSNMSGSMLKWNKNKNCVLLLVPFGAGFGTAA